MFETTFKFLILPAVNSDYVSEAFLFEFHPSNSTMACGSINITNNNTPENEEFFIAILTTSDSAVILSPNMTTITILDDDGNSLAH